MVCARALRTCEELLEALPKLQPSPDVILLDINLPGLSGLEAIGSVKSMAPGVQILMPTLADDRDTIFKALYAGASGYLLKDSSEVPGSIWQVAGGGAPLSPQVARLVLDSFVHRPQPVADYRLTPREQSVLE